MRLSRRLRPGIADARRNPPRIDEPPGVEKRYLSELRKMIGAIKAVVSDQVIPRLLDSTTRTDAKKRATKKQVERAQRLNDELGELRRLLTESFGEVFTVGRIEELAQTIVGTVDAYNAREVGQALSNALGIDLTADLLALDLTSVVERNVALIKSVGEQLHEQIERVLVEGILDGKRHETIAAELVERVGVAESRAGLIARDQVASLNAEFSKQRQTSVGVQKYRWSTSQDERVRKGKNSHRAREGQIFRWDEPPPDGHPGEPINCRCVAIPVFDDDEE